MLDGVAGDQLDFTGRAAFDLEYDVGWKRLAKMALTRNDDLAAGAVEGHVLETP